MTSVKLDICLKRGLFLSTLDPIHRMATTARCLPLDRAGLQLNGDAYPGSRTIAAAPASVRLTPARPPPPPPPPPRRAPPPPAGDGYRPMEWPPPSAFRNSRPDPRGRS